MKYFLLKNIKYIISLFSLSSFPIVQLFIKNKGELDISNITNPIITTFIIVLIIYSLFLALNKNSVLSYNLISIGVIYFFSYGFIFDYLKMNELIFNIVYLILYILSNIIFLKIKSLNKPLAIFFISTSLYFFLYGSTSLIINQVNKKKISTEIEKPFNLKQLSKYKPNNLNIFFIVVDAYAREDILLNLYDFKNDFVDFLKTKNFFVAQNSTSNYSLTELSIVSTLQFNYLNSLTSMLEKDSTDKTSLKHLLNNNKVCDFLRKQSYKIISLSLDKSSKGLLNADLVLTPKLLDNYFNSYLFSSSPLMLIYNTFTKFDPQYSYRNRTEFTLNPENYKNICEKIKTPFFFYNYIPIPHPPFVFDENGKDIKLFNQFNFNDGDWLVNENKLTIEEYKKYYIKQLTFLNSKLKNIVDTILKNSKYPPVIVLLSDHGPRSQLVWNNIENSNMKECMGTLLAVFFPDHDYKKFYNSISNVNIFRVIFNKFFETELPLLDDLNYYSAENLYYFTDVTLKTKNLKNELLFYSKGLKFFKEQNYSSAIKEFQKAYELVPLDKDINIYMGKCFFYLDDFKNAINHLNIALKNNINYDVYNYLGFSHFQLKEFSRTIFFLEKAVEYQDDYLMGHYYLCISYLELNDIINFNKHYLKVKDYDEKLAKELQKQLELKTLNKNVK